MKKLFAAVVIGGHRALFTMATALLGVAGSLAADKPEELGNWLLLAGAMLFMYVEDECGDIERASRKLSGKDVRSVTAQIDLMQTRAMGPIYGGVAVALGSLVAGGIALAC